MNHNDPTMSIKKAMPNTTRPLLLLLLVLLAFSCQQSQKPAEKRPFVKKAKNERLADLAEMEAEMLRDPRTGDIPTNTLHRVRRSLRQSADMSRNDIEWIARGPGDIGGRTRTVLVDARDSTGNTLWVGSVSGGLWRCENALVDPQWTRVDAYPGSPSVSSIVQDPNNPDILYLGTGEGWFNADAYRGDGIYKSTNGGDSWDRLPATNDVRYVQKLLISSEGRLFACTRDLGILVSDDGGDSWTTSLGNGVEGFSDRAADLEEASNGDLYAAMGIFTIDGIYRSKDSGNTWEYIDAIQSLGNFERIDISVAPSDSNVVLALMQDEETRACSHILRSDDGGETWRQLTVPPAIGMDNFARTQAWYDLVSAIDPLDPNTMYIGGVDLHKTTDGGQTWTQISQWFGSQVDYVHADQHELVFINNDPNKLLNTNDGGLWYTDEARANLPDFTDLSSGYISTQFYTCAIHPEAGVNYFMGGTQDNGTNAIIAEGLGEAIRISGGDGAFCHIDENEPDIQISAFQRGNYFVTTDGWNTSQQLSSEGDPYFINPTAFDSEQNILYAGYDAGEYVYYEIATLEPIVVTIPELLDGRISALTVDPSDPNILYLGTNQGTVVKVTNPTSLTPDVQVIYAIGAFARCITVDRNNSNRIVITFSNFGIDNLLLSDDGGSTWIAIDGNLPNVPVRWAVFNPSNSEQIVIATEVGVWEAIVADPNSEVEWNSINGGIGAVRVDMLQFRNSDFKLLAATYGRGLYTTDEFSNTVLQWSSSSTVVTEADETSQADCKSSYTLDVPIMLNKLSEEDAAGMVAISTSSTAIEGTDYDAVTLDFFIPAGELSDTVSFEIYDDLITEDDKTIQLSLESEFLIFRNDATITIVDNDVAFSSSGLSTDIISADASNNATSLPFFGFSEDARTQIYYPADFLSDIGLTQGEIISLQFTVSDKGSAQPYSNFTVRLANSQTALDNQFTNISDQDIYYSESFETSLGLMTIPLDRPFTYDGSGGILMEFCYDNDSWTSSDQVLRVADSRPSLLAAFSDNSQGCILESATPTSSVPLVGFEVRANSKLLADTEREFATTITGGETAYMSSGDSILASVVALSDNVEDCISVQLAADDRSFAVGEGFSAYGRILNFDTESDDNSYHISFAVPDISDDVAAGNYSMGYLPSWTGTFDDIEEGITLIPIDSIVTSAGLSTVMFQPDGSGVYFLIDFFVSVTDIEVGSEPYDRFVYFDLSGKPVVNIDQVPTGIYIKTYLFENSIVKSEKVLIVQE